MNLTMHAFYYSLLYTKYLSLICRLVYKKMKGKNISAKITVKAIKSTLLQVFIKPQLLCVYLSIGGLDFYSF